MSRSYWALAEARRRGASVHGVGERRRLDGRLHLERRLLPSADSATKYTVILLAAGILVLAMAPARALAASTRRVEPTHSSTSPVRPANAVLLAFGSGYRGGSNAVAVRALQHHLDGVGYSPGPIDGRYGARTERAVERFQSAHGLRVDGIAGPITLAALRTPATVFFPGAGYSGPGAGAVRRLQRRLRRDGYSPGPIDGRYGPLTARAVRRFQAAHRLRVDGVAGPETFGELRVLATRRPARTRPAASHRRKPSSAANPRRTGNPKPAHPGTPQATRSTRSSWPVVLVLAALLGLATAAGGVWLIGRRRRGLMDAGRPKGDGTAAAAEAGTATAAGAGTVPPHPQAEPGDSAGLERPADTEHVLELGFRLLEWGEEAAAERAYRYADERGDAVAASNLGVLLEHRGDRAGAEAAYRRADVRGSAGGAFNLAALLVERGDTEEAVAAYRRADRRGDAAAAVNLGLLLLEQGDPVAAQGAYRRADDRGDARAASELGLLLERVGDFPGAAQAYRRAAERGHGHGALRLGILLERRNDAQGALRAYERAQASEQPEIAEVARARALALSRGMESER
jgi:peptidoglycan hydrolase-like protein with peptidoglycan-binding domain/Flp pilus assembly protein TadD